MIAAGAAGVHWEDQLASREEVRPPGRQGADPDRPARPDAERGPAGRRRRRRADADHRPHRRAGRRPCSPPTSTSATSRSSPASAPREGFYRVRNGIEPCIARGLAYAPYSDLIWMETGTPDLGRGPRVRRGDPGRVPGPDAGLQLLAVVQLEQHLDDATIAKFQRELGAHGLQVPVHHPGRLPRAEPLDVRPRPGLRRRRHDRLRRAAGGASSPPRRAATPPPSTSARSAPATSTWSATAINPDSATTALRGSTEEEQFAEAH